MRFLAGVLLLLLALAIYRWIGRRPPVLRTLENGDRVLGPPANARPPRPREDVEAVPVRRVARDPAPSDRLATVMPGAWLELARDGQHWILANDDGRVAHVGRAGASPTTPSDALTDATGNLPDRGRVWVDRVLQDPHGQTIDLRGIALPTGE